MAIAIVLTFGLSSIAYVITSFTGQQPEIKAKTLDNFVVDGELDSNTEYEYYTNGYTFVKFYYINLSEVIPLVDQLPDLFKTTNDQIQLIVEKIQSNETYIKIMSLNGEDMLYNITEEELQKSLCNILLSAPLECVIADMNFTEIANNTTSGNETINNASLESNNTLVNNTNSSY